MKRISKWGQRHPIAARLIITISHLLIIANGILAGLFLFLNDLQHASYILFLFVLSFIILFIFYPKREQKTGLFKYSYRRQKTHDFGLVILGFLMISIGSNNWLCKNIHTEMTASPTATFIVQKHKKSSKRQFKKQIRKQLRALKKVFKNRKGNGLIRMLLNLLVFGGAIVLGFLLAVLCCNIHCSGSPGLAIAVGIVGYLGLIALVAFFIHKTMPKNPRSQTKKN